LRVLADEYHVDGMGPNATCNMNRLLKLVAKTKAKIHEEQLRFRSVWNIHDAGYVQQINGFAASTAEINEAVNAATSKLAANRAESDSLNTQRLVLEAKIVALASKIKAAGNRSPDIRAGTASAEVKIYIKTVATLDVLLKLVRGFKARMSESADAAEEAASLLEQQSKMAATANIKSLIEVAQLQVFAIKKDRLATDKLVVQASHSELQLMKSAQVMHIAKAIDRLEGALDAEMKVVKRHRQGPLVDDESVDSEEELIALHTQLFELQHELHMMTNRQYHLRMQASLSVSESSMRKLRLQAAAVEKQVIMTRRINARHAFEAESRMRTRQLELLQQIEALLKRHGKRACHKVVSEVYTPSPGVSYINQNALTHTVFFPKKYRKAPCVYLQRNTKAFIPHRYKLTRVTTTYFTVEVQRLAAWTDEQALSLTWNAVGNL